MVLSGDNKNGRYLFQRIGEAKMITLTIDQFTVSSMNIFSFDKIFQKFTLQMLQVPNPGVLGSKTTGSL